MRKLVAWALGAALQTAAVAAPRAVPIEVEAALERAGVPADALVVMVQEVGSRRARLAWQPERAVNPASLMKLFTTYAALDLLGPAWTWTTPVWLQGSVSAGANVAANLGASPGPSAATSGSPGGGVLDGNLVIKGTGDPKLVLERMWLLMRRVQQLGVTEIRGDIVLDRSAFAPPDQHPGDFDGEPLRPYNVGADALLLSHKSVVYSFTPDPARGVAWVGADPTLEGVRVEPPSVPLLDGPCNDWRGALRAELTDPLRVRFAGGLPAACGEKQWALAHADARAYNERALAALWREMGGKLGGTVRDGTAPTSAPSFEVASPALAEVVRDINKYSNNVMAQQVFLTLGLTQRGAGTPAQARAVLKAWTAERLGAATAAGVVIDNGSGLSRDSRASAQAIARLLQLAWAGPLMPELLSSLPLNGVDGTLRRSRAAVGRAHLKTGSLRDVAGVAGYVLANSGRRYVLVGVVNHANANAARPALDALVQWTVNDTLPPPDYLN
jgi:D-alanyl-D-alanine carboxypeptidase/D-alanyl-D-alanine-endopeptidase (penicillin-binding protein 4)